MAAYVEGHSGPLKWGPGAQGRNERSKRENVPSVGASKGKEAEVMINWGVS